VDIDTSVWRSEYASEYECVCKEIKVGLPKFRLIPSPIEII